MTAFTDDLENDLEVLAEHHDVTPVQVAKAALALVPDYLRHALISSLWAAIPTPVSEDPDEATKLTRDAARLAWDHGSLTATLATLENLTDAQRRTVLSHLLGDGKTLSSGPKATEEAPEPEFVQESTGLPQKLRGAIHSLTQNYPANLVADAAMLALPEKVRHDVARAFLPKTSPHEKLYAVVDVASGEELGKVKDIYPHMRVLDGKTGEPVDYTHLRTVPEYDFREADATPRMLVLYRKAPAK